MDIKKNCKIFLKHDLQVLASILINIPIEESKFFPKNHLCKLLEKHIDKTVNYGIINKKLCHKLHKSDLIELYKKSKGQNPPIRATKKDLCNEILKDFKLPAFKQQSDHKQQSEHGMSELSKQLEKLTLNETLNIKKIDELKKINNKHIQSNKSIQVQLENCKKTLESMTKKTDLDNCKRELASLHKTISTIKIDKVNHVKTATARIKELELSNAKQIRNTMNLQKQLDSYTNQIAESKKQLDSSTNQVANCKKQLDSSTDQVVKCKKQLDFCRNNLDDTVKTYQKRFSEYNKQINDYKLKEKQLQNRIQRLKEKQIQHNINDNVIRDDLKSAQIRLKVSSKVNEDQMRQNKLIQQQLDKCKNAVRNMVKNSNKLDNCEKELQDIKKTLSVCKETNKNLNQTKDILTNQKRELEMQITVQDTLRKNIKKYKKDYDNCISNTEKMKVKHRQDIQNYEDQLSESNNIIEDLKIRLGDLVKSHIRESKTLKTQIAQDRNDKKVLESQLQKFESNKGKLNECLSNIEKLEQKYAKQIELYSKVYSDWKKHVKENLILKDRLKETQARSISYKKQLQKHNIKF